MACIERVQSAIRIFIFGFILSAAVSGQAQTFNIPLDQFVENVVACTYGSTYTPGCGHWIYNSPSNGPVYFSTQGGSGATMIPTFSPSMILLTPAKIGPIFSFSISMSGKPLLDVTIDPLGRQIYCGIDSNIANTWITTVTTLRGHSVVCSDLYNVPIAIRSVKIVGGEKLCKVADKRTVPFRYQTDPQWASDPYGIVANSKKPGTMAKYGCSVAAADMIFESYGIHTTPLGSPTNPANKLPFVALPGLDAEPLTPGSLNKAMASYRSKFVGSGSDALDANNNPLWPGVVDVARAGYQAQCQNPANNCSPANAPNIVSYKHYGEGFTVGDGSLADKEVESEICSGNPVMLKFGKASGGQHFMLATGYQLDAQGHKTFILNNPGINTGNNKPYETDLKSRYPTILGYVLFHPSSDPSMMAVTAPLNVHLVITDPLGRRTGFDPTTSTRYSEIPGASYVDQSIDSPNEVEFTPSTLVAERYFISSQDVPPGSYQVKVFGVSSGTYYLDYRSYDSVGTTNDATYKSGTILAGASDIVSFQHSLDLVPAPNADIKVKRFSVKNAGLKASRINFSGKVEPFSGAGLELKSSLQITIGGVSGYHLALPASAFEYKVNGGQARYSYRQNGIEVGLQESGDFKIEINQANLSGVDSNQIGYLRLDVDNINADADVKLKCNNEKCFFDADKDQDDHNRNDREGEN